MSPGELPRACGPQIRAFLLVHSAVDRRSLGCHPRTCSHRWVSESESGRNRPPSRTRRAATSRLVGGNCPQSLLQCPWDPRSARLRHPDEITDIDRVLVTRGRHTEWTRGAALGRGRCQAKPSGHSVSNRDIVDSPPPRPSPSLTCKPSHRTTDVSGFQFSWGNGVGCGHSNEAASLITTAPCGGESCPLRSVGYSPNPSTSNVTLFGRSYAGTGIR